MADDVCKKSRSPVRGKVCRDAFDRFEPARRWTRMTSGIMIRSLREMQEMSQAELAKKAGLTQALVSNLEHDRVALGLARAKAMAKALHVHPAVLLFP